MLIMLVTIMIMGISMNNIVSIKSSLSRCRNGDGYHNDNFIMMPKKKKKMMITMSECLNYDP